jgi:hypothetical protein
MAYTGNDPYEEAKLKAKLNQAGDKNDATSVGIVLPEDKDTTRKITISDRSNIRLNPTGKTYLDGNNARAYEIGRTKPKLAPAA